MSLFISKCLVKTDEFNRLIYKILVAIFLAQTYNKINKNLTSLLVGISDEFIRQTQQFSTKLLCV
ncbi:hypothetical protein PL9214290882 [Planktothrix tepida PCC 9214]|uniref:Uncharacterized protein n=1 Tax=Planktothrix tepida PCC 9214 TaxID=671072 RepID=A0A1J1LFD1_9CYAN|nr:hypothetical protein PL9214290882 [Planktothrix tepida PCC 9214]